MNPSEPNTPIPGQTMHAMRARLHGLVQSGELPVVELKRIKGRYELGELVLEQGEIGRFCGLDHGLEGLAPTSVIIVRSSISSTGEYKAKPSWSSPEWEEIVLEKARHSTLPRVLDCFKEDSWKYLVLEAPTGRSFWDAWDDSATTMDQCCTWLQTIAEGLHTLHQAGAMAGALRPDQFIVTGDGQVRFRDLSGLLPLRLSANLPIKDTSYTAPEMILAPEKADARADLYGFGAMLYSLYLGRELTEMDFEGSGLPKAIISQHPDVHPLLGRLLSKTFCREVGSRFPTDEAAQKDPTGFSELIQTLKTCQKLLDHVRLDIAAWTTTGMVRSGNEDAFSLLHAIGARQDELAESALILLADGMGGYEAGEVAAAMAIQTIRQFLLEWPQFAALAGGKLSGPATMDRETVQNLLHAAIKEANRQVYEAARSGTGHHGMGCTVEIVYVQGRRVFIGHVGDCRTYHLRDGRLELLTRDQTLIQRLVELGQITAEEAEQHPQKSELQQAIGGHAEVEPEFYHSLLQPGDWLVVCSDGLSNDITPAELRQMLVAEATSAEMAARRLVNLANIKGATDNATVVVIRVT